MDELVSADFVAYGTGGDGRTIETRGPGPFKEWLRWYLSAFADREWTVHEVISDGGKAVARYSGWATYRGGVTRHPLRRPARARDGYPDLLQRRR